MSEDRFCRDCKFAKEQGGIDSFRECRRPQAIIRNTDYFVTGEIRYRSCLDMRSNTGTGLKDIMCGPDGILWEKKS